MGAFALVVSGCLLRDAKLVEDEGPKPADVGQHTSGNAFGSSAKGGAGGIRSKGGSGGSGGSGEEGGAGAGGRGGSGATRGATNPDLCARSVCRAEYPCQALESGYTCRGQFADWPPAYSASAFTASNGTVRDSRSGLVWQQSVPSSYAPACSGKYSSDSPAGDACTWVDAKKYCAGLSFASGGWRLPSKAELESLVDDSRVAPAIDLNAFPSTLPSGFWSSSPSAGSSDSAWYVGFYYGHSDNSDTGGTFRVRCVR